MQNIGISVVKTDALAKVTGEALYAGDVRLEGMLYAAAARASCAHGQVRGVDCAKAAAYPGVIAVYTAKDIPGTNLSSPTGKKDQPVINNEHIRFLGEAVAVVVADTMVAARAAAKMVSADIVPLPQVAVPADALREDAPRLYDTGNVLLTRRTVKGDIDAAEREADLIVENTYETHAVDHAYIEPDACVVYWEGETLQALTSTKSAHHDREGICHFLGLSEGRVHVRAQQVGGSFGGKSDMQMICMASLAAYKTGRPVLMALTREEVMAVTTKRHPATIRFRHAVKNDGTILGIRVDLVLEAGAYGGYSGSVLTRCVGHAVGPYHIPNVLVEGRAVHTNKPSSGAMRGYGTPQLSFAYESQMDIIADRLGISPWAIRIKNAILPGQKSGTGQMMSEDIRFLDTILSLEKTLPAPLPRPERPGVYRGRGIACFVYGNGRTGLPNPGRARCAVNPDGTVTCYVGSPDIGQGSDTAFRQIVAQTLGLPVHLVRCVSADTLCTDDSGTTSGTRLTFVVGNGVRIAAETLLLTLQGYMRKKGIAGDPAEELLSVAQMAQDDGVILEGHGQYDPDTVPLDEEGRGKPYGAYTYGIQCADVSVNALTGRVTVDRVFASYDSGTIINPALYRGQIEGGIAQGIGYAIMEEMSYRPDGRVGNGNFDRYLLPTSLDMPETDVRWISACERAGPFGAKGIGEPATIPTAAAIANAAAAATGIRFYRLPLNLENVQAAINYSTGPAETGRGAHADD